MTLTELSVVAALLGRTTAVAIDPPITTIPGDATLVVTEDAFFLLTKGSAAAITLPDPGADNIGRKITIMAGSDFAHVVTTTAALANGTAVKNTWTSAAFTGSSLTLRAISSTLWGVVNHELGAFA